MDEKTKIVSAESFPIKIPFRYPLTYAKGTLEYSNTVLVRLVDEAGREGWGETNDYPFAFGNDQAMISTKLNDHLLPAIIGQEPQQIRNIHRAMDAAFRFDTRAKSAVDMAAYDLAGHQRNLSLSAMMGGKRMDKVPVTAAITFASPAENAKSAKEHIKIGYTSIKLKIGGDPYEDVLRITAVREAIGARIPLRVDANAAYDRPTALRVLQQLAPFDIGYVEQPLRNEDLSGMAWLASQSPIPIAADDAMETLADAFQFCASHASSALVLKLIKCGGLYHLQNIAAMAKAVGVPCTLSSGMDTSIATSAVLHSYATLDGLSGGAEVTTGFYAGDVVHTPIEVGSEMDVPTGPGLGISVDMNKVESFLATRLKTNNN